MNEERETGDRQDFEDRLARAQAGRRDKTASRQGSTGGMGAGYRLSMDLVSAILVGSFLGYWLDRWFNTSPGFLIGLFLLGCVAGFTNMMRTLRRMDQEAAMAADDQRNRDADEK